MSSIFISHSKKDNATAALIREWLAKQGYTSRFLDFDPQEGIPAGRNWERELYRQLRAAQAVIALCSEHSMASEWCFAEITQARALGKPVFAVKIGPCKLKSILTPEQAVDYTVNPEQALERLARGLTLAGLDPRDSFRRDETRSPYPGLRLSRKPTPPYSSAGAKQFSTPRSCSPACDCTRTAASHCCSALLEAESLPWYAQASCRD